MTRKLLWGLVGLLIALPIVGSIAGIKILQIRAMIAAGENMVEPPTPVTVTEVREEQWQPRVSAVGSVAAVQGVAVTAEAEGVVREIAFTAGSMVEAGEVLVKLDTDVEESQLRAAEAAAELARANKKRAEELLADRTISQAEYDAANATLKETQARADNIRAVIAKKTIRAPFAGRLGIRKISVGQFISKGDPVVSLQSLDPVYVEFSLPQRRLGDLEEGLGVAVSTDAYPDEQFQGEVTAINPDVDRATRNVRIQATLANADGRLRPGMYVSLDLILARTDRVLFIPATAVQHAPYGDTVFVVEEGGAADGKSAPVLRQQTVRLGAGHGDYVMVNDGLQAGEKVVSSGAFKLFPGMAVEIDNTLEPDFKLDPRPGNS